MTQEIVNTLKILQKAEGKSMLAAMPKSSKFQVLISTILSARAKDEVTIPVSQKLFEKYPNAEKLAKAKINDVKKIIKQIGFYNVKAKNIIGAAKMLLKEFNGRVPDNISDLTKLPGVGRKVANCVLVYSFGQEAIPVDTHVHRISNRLGWVSTKTPEQTEQELEKKIPKKYWTIVNDVLVTHGQTICKPTSPICSKCPIAGKCKRAGVTKYR